VTRSGIVQADLAAWLEGLALAAIDDADLVAGRFLRHCRRSAAALRRARSARLDRVLAVDRRELALALQPVAETGLVRRAALAHPDGALALLWGRAHGLAAGDDDAARALVARMAAEALDDACGELFAEGFRRRARWLIAPGEPYPPVAADLVRVFGKQLITHPSARGDDDVDRTPRLALAPDSGGLEVEINFEHLHLLQAPAADSVLAVILPIAEPTSELTWDQVAAPVRSFFHVRPRQPDVVMARATQLLDEAARRGADIAILPELSLDAAGLDHLRAHLRARGWPFRLVCAGSVHTTIDGHPRNAATLILPGGHEIQHHKFNPFSSPLVGEEAIATTPARIGLHVAADDRGRPGWSYTLLICKDLLSRFARDVLAELRPGLVLVPAWSGKTIAFELDIHGLLSATQSAVVLANQVDLAEAAEASVVVMGRPTRVDTVAIVRRNEANPPQCLAFRLNDGRRLDRDDAVPEATEPDS